MTKDTQTPDPVADKIGALTPEQLEQDRQQFLHRMGFAPKPGETPAPQPPQNKSADEKTPEERAADVKAKEKADAAAKEAEAKAKKDAEEAAEKKRKEEEAAKIKEIADAAAERVADKLKAVKTEEPLDNLETPQAKIEPPKPTVSLKPEEEELISAMRILEQSDPNAKGLADRTLKFWEMEEAKAKAWEQEHPGEKFNPKDDEHASWYEENEPEYDSDALDRARDQVKEQRIVERVRREAREETEKAKREIEFKQRLEAEAPEIVQVAFDSSMEMVRLANEELWKQIPEKDGKKIITPEFLKEAEEKEPVAVGIIKEESEKMEYMVVELEKLRRYPDQYGIKKGLAVVLTETGEKFYPHREILAFAERLEEEMSELPKEQTQKQVKIGDKTVTKDFISQEQFFAKHDKIQSSNLPDNQKQAALRDLSNRYWILDGKAIRRALVKDKAEKIEKHLSKINQLAEKKYGQRKSTATPEAPTTPPPDTTIESLRTGRSKPPTSASSSDISTLGKTGANSKADSDAMIDRKMGWA